MLVRAGHVPGTIFVCPAHRDIFAGLRDTSPGPFLRVPRNEILHMFLFGKGRGLFFQNVHKSENKED